MLANAKGLLLAAIIAWHHGRCGQMMPRARKENVSGWSSLPRRTVKEISMDSGRKWLDQPNSHLTLLLLAFYF